MTDGPIEKIGSGVISTVICAIGPKFCRLLLILLFQRVRACITHVRSKRPQLPEDGYHRPDNSDDLVAATPKKSLLDRLDGVLAKWNRMLNEPKK